MGPRPKTRWNWVPQNGHYKGNMIIKQWVLDFSIPWYSHLKQTYVFFLNGLTMKNRNWTTQQWILGPSSAKSWGPQLESLGLRLLQLDTARSLDEIVDQLTTEVDPSCMLLIIGNHWGLSSFWWQMASLFWRVPLILHQPGFLSPGLTLGHEPLITYFGIGPLLQTIENWSSTWYPSFLSHLRFLSDGSSDSHCSPWHSNACPMVILKQVGNVPWCSHI
jgi:hypothetical protein